MGHCRQDGVSECRRDKDKEWRSCQACTVVQRPWGRSSQKPSKGARGRKWGEEGQIPGPLGLQPEGNFILVPEKPGGALGSSRERAGLL